MVHRGCVADCRQLRRWEVGLLNPKSQHQPASADAQTPYTRQAARLGSCGQLLCVLIAQNECCCPVIICRCGVLGCPPYFSGHTTHDARAGSGGLWRRTRECNHMSVLGFIATVYVTASTGTAIIQHYGNSLLVPHGDATTTPVLSLSSGLRPARFELCCFSVNGKS